MKKIIITMLVFFLLVNISYAEEIIEQPIDKIGTNPSTNWDLFVDWFLGITPGVDPKLQLLEVKQDNIRPTQKYKLKDVEDKTISVEIIDITNANYDNLRFKLYEDNVCTRKQLKTVPDIENGTLSYYEDVEYACPSYNEYPISELQNKRNSIEGFFEPDFMIDWGEVPQENCVTNLVGYTICEQKVA